MMWAGAKSILLCLVLLAGYLTWMVASQAGKAGSVCETPVIVEVLNGCGRPGVAEQIAEALRNRGFDVMFISNADDFRYANTLVVDRSGDRSKALAIAGAMGAVSVISQVSSATFADATVVIGSDIETLSLEGYAW
jgi:hypothetical protein